MTITCKVPLQALRVSLTGTTLRLTGIQQGILLSLMTNYNTSWFVFGDDDKPIYNNDVVNQEIADIIDQLSEPP